MKHSITLYLFCFLLFSAYSCRKDSYFEDKDTIIPPPTIFYLVNISGLVTDDSGQPLQGAEVEIGSTRVSTDRNGAYLFRNLRVPEDLTVIKVKASGFESQLHLIIPEKGKTFRHDFSLMQKINTATFNNNEGVTIELANQAKLEIPANAIQLFSGVAYNGEVRLFAEFLDPKKRSDMQRSPGLFFSGIGLENKKNILSHGLLHVRMETPSGVKLKLNPDYPAKFKAPVLQALLQQSDLGASIWYLDEMNGNWKQGQTIQRNGSFFETSINDLSWVTYGKLIDCHWISGQVESTSNIPLSQSTLDINVGEFYQNIISPSSDGRFRVLVPSHNSVKLNLKSTCNTTLYSRQFASLHADTDLGNIRISNLHGQSILKGSFIFCPDKPGVAYIIAESGGYKRLLFPSGQNIFSTALDFCSSQDSVRFTVVNASLNRSSQAVTLPGNMLQYDLGQIELCGELELLPSWAFLSIGNLTYFSAISSATLRKIKDVSLYGYELNVSSYLNNREIEIQILLFDLEEGYTLNPVSGFRVTGAGTHSLICNLPSQSCDLDLIVSHYHGPGGRLKGTFRGAAIPGLEMKGGFNMRVVESR